jgi:hypothetical protein
MKIFDSIVKVKLLKPIQGYDKEITEIDLDFSKITVRVLTDTEKAVLSSGNMSVILKATSMEYCGRLAGSICGLGYTFIEKLNYGDFDTIYQVIGAYILGKNPQKFYDQLIANDEYEEAKEIDPLS